MDVTNNDKKERTKENANVEISKEAKDMNKTKVNITGKGHSTIE